jgi:hypothetical protein
MSISTLYDSTRAALAAHLTDIRDSQLTNLALLVAAAVQAQSCHLADLARAMPIAGLQESKQQRVRRTLDNERITQATHVVPILQAALAGLRGQAIALLIDRVIINTIFNVLVVSVAFKRRSIPVAWTILEHDGTTNLAEQQTILTTALACLPSDVRVTIQGDGEFRSTALFGWIRQLGHHAILGVKSDTYVSDHADGRGAQPIAARYGNSRDVQYWSQVYITKDRVGPVNLLVWWQKDEQGKEQIRVVMTDLPATKRTWQQGRRRMWIETLFRDWKSSGFGLNTTGLQDADRLSALLIPLVIAYVWFVSVGRWVVKRSLRRLIDDGTPDTWHYSLFQLGVGWLDYCQSRSQPMPVILYVYP